MKRTNKSARQLSLGTIAIAGLAVAGCEPAAQAPPTPVQFGSVAECISAGNESATCDASYRQALTQHQAEAPRYDGKEPCEKEWGAGNCDRPSGGGGGNVFMPLLAGYLVGQAVNGNNRYGGGYGGYYGSPIYRQRGGMVQLAPGGGAGSAISRGTFRTTAITAPKGVNIHTTTVARGGFGGSMSRGGFGG